MGEAIRTGRPDPEGLFEQVDGGAVERLAASPLFAIEGFGQIGRHVSEGDRFGDYTTV